MKTICVTIALCFVCFGFDSTRAHSSSLEADSCDSVANEIKSLVQGDQRAKGLSLRVASLPNVEEDLVTLQFIASSNASATAVHGLAVCQISPSKFEIRDGHITKTTVVVDRELPNWLVVLGPGGKRFLLSGFPDSVNNFNQMIEEIGLQIANPDVALNVFDLYLMLTGGETLRESVLSDDLQLQALGLEYFRLNYSEAKARAMYNRWWAGVSPALKRALHRPEIKTDQDAFRVGYYQFRRGQVSHESMIISKRGSIAAGATRTVYAYNPR